MPQGKLYVVATPIGNMDDFTIRAADTLRSADFILCEDTRVTKNLLIKFDIQTKLISFNAATEEKKIPAVLEHIKDGENCALVSDAGTPGISDPGIRLVNAAIKIGIEINGIPGANAAILALSIAGFPTDSFLFEGFLPQKKGRQKKLKELSETDKTIVLYESVYRIEKLIDELMEYSPNRLISVCRELTKKFEEVWRGSVEEIKKTLPEKNIKGEFVIVLAPISWKE